MVNVPDSSPGFAEGILPVNDVIGVIVDPLDEHFGTPATIRSHDWRESGDMLVDFENGEGAVLRGGYNNVEGLPVMRGFDRRYPEQVKHFQRLLVDSLPILLTFRTVAVDEHVEEFVRLSAVEMYNLYIKNLKDEAVKKSVSLADEA
jgi:hypothetical protein